MGARLVIRSIDGRRVTEDLVYPCGQERLVLGRGRSADVRIPHRTVSEAHALLESTADGYRLTDQGSTNGTWVGDQRLVAHRSKRLDDGDLVRLGVYALSFHEDVAVTAPLTADHTAELARQLVRRHLSPGQDAARPPRLVVIAGGPMGAHVDLPAAPSRVVIGRAESCELQLDDPDVSREHMEVVHDDQGVLVRDLESKNGLVICGRPLLESRIVDGDELELGGCTLLFEEPAQAPLEALDGSDDEALGTPPQLPEAAVETQAQERIEADGDAPANAAAAPAEAPSATSERPGLGPDLLVYGLAGLVLALSVAGLVLLMGD